MSLLPTEIIEKLRLQASDGFFLAVSGFSTELESQNVSVNRVHAKNSALDFLYRILILQFAQHRGFHFKLSRFSILKTSIEEIVRSSGNFDSFRRDETSLYDTVAGIADNIPYSTFVTIDTCKTLEQPVSLRTVKLSDHLCAQIIHLVSFYRREGSTETNTFNFAEISTTVLGTIYENLLELDVESPHDRTSGLFRGNEGDVKRITKSSKRKTSGSFYTPEHVVNNILELALGGHCERIELECSHVPLPERVSELEKRFLALKIVDPSMGSGHFLVGALNFLTDRIERFLSRQSGLGDILFERNVWKNKIAENCLYGLDLDPIAVDLARAAMWLEVGPSSLMYTGRHLRCGNALVGALSQICPHLFAGSPWQILTSEISGITERTNALTELKGRLDRWCVDVAFENVANPQLTLHNSEFKNFTPPEFEEKNGALKPFHWELEFPELFLHGENPGFDAVVGNPPYGLTRNEVISHQEERFLALHYQPFISGKPNKFLLFEARAHQLVKVGGSVGFLGPNSWFAIPAGRAMRKYLLTEQHVSDINYYCYPVFPSIGVEVAAVISRRERSQEPLRIRRFATQKGSPVEFEMSQTECTPPEFIIPLNRPPEIAQLLRKLQSTSIPIGDREDILVCRVGLQAYARGKGVPKQSADIVASHPFHADAKRGPDWYKYIDGSDIGRFSSTWSGRWFHHGPWLAEFPPIQEYSGPRIAIREIIGEAPHRLLATFLEGTLFYNRSILHVIPGSNGTREHLLALLCIFCSSIGSFFISYAGRKSDRVLFPKIILKDLKQFPLPNKFSRYVERLAELAEQHLGIAAPSEASSLFATMDSLVAECFQLELRDLEQIKTILMRNARPDSLAQKNNPGLNSVDSTVLNSSLPGSLAGKVSESPRV